MEVISTLNHSTRLLPGRIICMLLCCMLALSAFAPFSARAEGTVWPNPTISPDANKYDANHPEDLEPDQLASASAILIEEQTGRVIFEKDPDRRLYPASTTKIMTVLLALMSCELDEIVTVSANALNLGDEDATRMGLREGEEIKMIDLLYGTILRSGNDGANAIAEHVSGSIENFVQLMNQTAQILGCTQTNFTNPHGLHDDYHFSSARDLAIIAREAMKNDVFRKIANTVTYNLPGTNMQRSRTITTRHKILIAPTGDSSNRHYYQYATGIKSGSHSKAAYCYVGSATRDGVDLISVVMFSNSTDMYADTRKLMEYGFSQFVNVTPVDLYNMNPITIETSGYSLKDTDMGRLNLICVPADASSQVDITATQAEIDHMAANLRETMYIEYIRDFAAPVAAGEVMGTMTYYSDRGKVHVYNLVAERSIGKRENAPKTLAQIVAETEADPNPWPPFSVDIVLLVLTPTIIFILVIMILRFFFRKFQKRQAKLPKNSNRYFK